MMRHLAYRIHQFFEVLLAYPAPVDLELAQQILTPEQITAFSRLQPSEQAHAVRVLRAVQALCQKQGMDPSADLKVAALLHDVGKACYPLRLWERVMIVVGKAILPDAARRWGSGSPRGWKRPFVVAAQHPNWGAEIAAGHGASPGAVALIRRHQDRISQGLADIGNDEDRLLAILQAVDNEN